jgi:uncharacterized protein with beta-barrel porin domain
MHRTSLRAVLIAGTALSAAPLFAVLSAAGAKAQMITQSGGNGGATARFQGGLGGVTGGGGGASTTEDGGSAAQSLFDLAHAGAGPGGGASGGDISGGGGGGGSPSTPGGNGGLTDQNGSDSAEGGGGGGSEVFGSVVALNVTGVINGGFGGAGGTGGGGGGAVGMAFIPDSSGTPPPSLSVTVAAGAFVVGGSGGTSTSANAGDGGAGAFFYYGGTLSKQGQMLGGNGGGSTSGVGGKGAAGVLSNGANLTNQGLIVGGVGGQAGTGSQTGTVTGALGGNGVEMYGGTLINSAQIQGGNGGANGTLHGLGGDGGDGVLVRSGMSATVTNTGTIAGGSAGSSSVSTTTGGGYGVDIEADNSTLINKSRIEGGLSTNGTQDASVHLAGANDTLQIQNSSQFIGSVVATGANATLEFTGAGTFDASQLGPVQLYQGFANFMVNSGGNNVQLTGPNTFTGATVIQAGVVQVGSASALSANSALTVASGATIELNGLSQTIASLSGGGQIDNGSGTAALTTGGDNTNTNFSGTIINTISLAKVGSGMLTLSGNSAYTGATTVSDGTLNVLGSIASSSLTTVQNGATLTGGGTVGNTTIASGGIFAPGNASPNSSMTVTGNLALDSGAIYMVQVNPATASFASVSGTANLGGATVNATFASGTYVEKKYTILTTVGLIGTKFDTGIATVGLPSNFHTTLSYDSNNAYLNLALNFTPPPPCNDCGGDTPPPPQGPSSTSGLNLNQQRVANTLVNFFNTTGGIPMAFGALMPAGLTQVSGEVATGSQQTTFDAMSMFMGLMTDPSSATRGEPVAPTSPAQAYAAMSTKAFPRFQPAFTPGWRVWSAGFGGSETTQGNSTIGSNDTTSRIFGGAAGADYHFSPDTLLGFALAGGGTNFSVANGGTGRSDLFQAGTYMRHNDGAAYVTAALAYGWQDIITNRSIGADQLRAEFNANAYSGRIEGGYRFSVFNGFGITPYAAAQSTVFDLPGYSESTAGSGLFALSYDAMSVTDTRSELGFRTDKAFAVDNAVLTLRGRAAWAHDFNTDRSVAATFQSLPGASFVVDGAAQAPDSALVSASAELAWRNGWSVAGTFDGEFSNVTQSYAAKGVVRYAW